MRSVGIRTLKNRLSEYIRIAASGEVVLVTDRDRVVAELSPPSPGRAAWVGDAHLAEAVRKGWLTPPLLAGTPLPTRTPTAPLEKILGELGRDREER